MTFKELLKQADVHGAQLARKLGVTTSAVSSWVRGVNAPTCKYMLDIAKYLNVSVEQVVQCFAKKE
jgi:transcriptional regulator with XRE-family HTH domain